MQNIPIGLETALCTPCESPIIEKHAADEELSRTPHHRNSLIIEEVCKYFGSCSVEGCPLNSEYSHMISFYSNALFCVSHHKENILAVRSEYLKNISDFEKIVLLSVQIDRSFKPIHVGVFDLHCEQDIESLTYKTYEKIFSVRKSDVSITDCYFVLEILLYRKEYERFFIIYEGLEERTIGIYKLAIMASLYAKREKIPKILIQIKNALNLANVNVEENESSDKKYRTMVENAEADSPLPLATQEENLLLFHTIRTWYLDKYKKHHWDMSISMWNISKNAEGASEAMIDRCIRHRKYEEGWYIYKESLNDAITPLRMFRLSRRILLLIIHAINNCNTNMWVEHYLEIATVISRLKIDMKTKVKNTFTVLHNLRNYHHITCIGGLIIKQYPEDLLCTSEPLSIILYDIYEILKEHENMIMDEIASRPSEEETGEKSVPELARYALISYSLWRRKNTRGLFISLFWGRSKASIEIYTLILHIAMIIKNKEQIVNICKDIWNDSVEVTDSLAFSLAYIHGTYTNCSCLANTNSRSYLMHVLLLLSGTQ